MEENKKYNFQKYDEEMMMLHIFAGILLLGAFILFGIVIIMFFNVDAIMNYLDGISPPAISD